MTVAGSRLMAAAFRSAGIAARIVPESDERTRELGGMFADGEECYPHKVTLGDFVKIIRSPDFDPEKTAFFMPSADGPCRFGQYAPCLRRVLEQLGYPDIPVVSVSTEDGYDQANAYDANAIRNIWRGCVAADIIRKLRLRTRPYERVPGAADEAFEASVQLLEKVLEDRDLSLRERMAALREALLDCRERFRNVPASYTRDRPLIGMVGEIFCRLSTFSNQDAARQIENHGGEVWISDFGEWVWYTNWYQKYLLKRDGKRISAAMLKAVIKNKVQHADERQLLELFEEDFVGYEDPHDLETQILKPASPYLPYTSSFGEMVLSVGKSIYLQRKGADGVIDIAPFGCMNSLVSEAVYPAVSRDHDDLPIRSFYFDAGSSNMERDLDIFMELADTYRKRKTRQRRYPPCFGG